MNCPEVKSKSSGIEIVKCLTLGFKDFTSNNLEFGRMELKNLGVPESCPYICFHAREASYLKTHNPEVDWDYHFYRNADINNYIPAVERIVSKGYYALRMGRFVSKKIETDNPKIIDYADKGGTDLLDMYLSAHCRFFISGSDGLAEFPIMFRRPVIWIDFMPFTLSALCLILSGQLFIPKKLWSQKEKRMLTFDELLNTKVAQYTRTDQFQKAGIEVINNTAEEIVDVSMEMEERLNGTWNESEEDKELQRRLGGIVNAKNKHKFFQ